MLLQELVSSDKKSETQALAYVLDRPMDLLS